MFFLFSTVPFFSCFGPYFLLPFVLFGCFYFQPLDEIKGYDVVELRVGLYPIKSSSAAVKHNFE